MPESPDPNGYLRRFDDMSVTATNKVITSYSTSFTLATRLLASRVRTDIRNLYAMVRIADEIVKTTNNTRFSNSCFYFITHLSKFFSYKTGSIHFFKPCFWMLMQVFSPLRHYR